MAGIGSPAQRENFSGDVCLSFIKIASDAGSRVAVSPFFFNPRKDSRPIARISRAMYRIFLASLVLMIISAFSVHFLEQAQTAAASSTERNGSPPQHTNSNIRSVVIKADRGHYWTDARVDGRRLDFMVDTGATQIALRESDAARLGYRPRPSDYNVRVSTANGEGRAARIELSRVDVGDITVRDVTALVVPDSALSGNLLGMSFLSRVRWTQDHGELVLEQ
jgi:aspartyl protease family protein